MQDVVTTSEAAGPLNRKQVRGMRHHAEQTIISRRIAAHIAWVAFGQVHANGTKADALFDLDQCPSQALRLLGGGAQYEEGQPSRRFLADSR